MYCSKCGSEISDLAVLCVRCGEKVTPLTKPNHFCTNCGSKNEGMAVICHQCGESLASNRGNRGYKKPEAMLPVFVGFMVYGGISVILKGRGILLGGIPTFILILALISTSEAIYYDIRKRKADKTNAPRLRYVSMSYSDQAASLSDRLIKLGAPSSTAEIISKLYEDTLFCELTDSEQEQLMSNKSVMSFLRNNGIDIKAQRRIENPSVRTGSPLAKICPKCGSEDNKKDIFCFHCGNRLIAKER